MSQRRGAPKGAPRRFHPSVPVSVPAVRGRCPRPRSLTVVPSERERSSVPSVSALARLRRAGGQPPAEQRPPTCIGSRRFRTSGRVFLPPLGRYGRTAYPSSLQSEKRTQRPKLVAIAESPFHSDSAGPGSVLLRPGSAWRLRRPCLRFTPIPRGLVQSCYARGRRGGFAAPAAAATDLCCGPRYEAIWHADAHQLTTPRGPPDEALRNSDTPTGVSGLGIRVWGR